MSSVAHLARRFLGSLSHAEPAAADLDWVAGQLLPAELDRWTAMAVQDRRHSIEVARRFVELAPEAGRPAVAAALLHDVGKQVAALGTMQRVLATVVGPRTKRYRDYHLHETIGAALLREAGSDEVTVALVEGRGPLAETLRRADDV